MIELVILPIIVSKLYFNNINFRIFNTGILSLMSLYHIFYYGSDLTIPGKDDVNRNIFSFQYESLYALVYLTIDLQNAMSRTDLLLHHIVVIFWIYLNYASGITIMCLINELITVTYLISNMKNQAIARLLIICLIRYPIWIITACSEYYGYSRHDYYHRFFNKTITNLMMILDIFWFYSYLKKYISLKKLKENTSIDI